MPTPTLSRIIPIAVAALIGLFIMASRGLPVFFLIKAIPLFIVFIILFLVAAAALSKD